MVNSLKNSKINLYFFFLTWYMLNQAVFLNKPYPNIPTFLRNQKSVYQLRFDSCVQIHSNEGCSVKKNIYIRSLESRRLLAYWHYRKYFGSQDFIGVSIGLCTATKFEICGIRRTWGVSFFSFLALPSKRTIYETLLHKLYMTLGIHFQLELRLGVRFEDASCESAQSSAVRHRLTHLCLTDDASLRGKWALQ